MEWISGVLSMLQATVDQAPGPLLPANLAMQVLQTAITAVLAFGLPLLLKRLQVQLARQIELREQATAAERERVAAEVKAKAEADAERVKEAVSVEIRRAREEVERHAGVLKLDVAALVREEFGRYRNDFVSGQQRMLDKLDSNSASTEDALHAANSVNEKISELRESFNALLTDGAEQGQGSGDTLNQKAEHIEEVSEDTNERVQDVQERVS